MPIFCISKNTIFSYQNLKEPRITRKPQTDAKSDGSDRYKTMNY